MQDRLLLERTRYSIKKRGLQNSTEYVPFTLNAFEKGIVIDIPQKSLAMYIRPVPEDHAAVGKPPADSGPQTDTATALRIQSNYSDTLAIIFGVLETLLGAIGLALAIVGLAYAMRTYWLLFHTPDRTEPKQMTSVPSVDGVSDSSSLSSQEAGQSLVAPPRSRPPESGEQMPD